LKHFNDFRPAAVRVSQKGGCMKKEPALMRISDLENLSGVPRYTIHRYIRLGLLPQPLRTGKTVAYYRRDHLERLLALKEIKGSARLPAAYLKKVLEEREGRRVKRPAGEIPAGEEPRRETGELKRRKIRDAAARIFLEKGYQRARIQDITDAAGISVGTFYIYFRDKKELFMEIVDQLLDRSVAAAEEAFRQGGDVVNASASIARLYMENYAYFSGIINQLRGMMAETEPEARDRFAALHNRLADPIIRGIREAMERGVIREVDPELLARAIMGMVEFLSIFLTFDRRYDASQATSFLMDLLLNGLGREGRRRGEEGAAATPPSKNR